MRVEFYLDKETLSDFCFCTENNPAAHDLLLKTWHESGVFILPKNRPEHIQEVMNSVPTKFRKRWQEALIKFPKAEVNHNIPYLSQVQNDVVVSQLAEDIKSLLVSSTIDYSFIDKDIEHRWIIDNKTEAVRASHITSSLLFNECAVLREKQISADENPSQIWKSRFDSLFKHEKNICIVDRYFADRIVESIKKGKLQNNSLHFLLKEMGRYKSKYNLSIFTDGKEMNGNTHKAIMKFVQENKSMFSNIANFQFMSIRSICFKESTHDRYIRIGNNLCEIGLGMEIFEFECNRRASFSMKNALNTDVFELETKCRKDILWNINSPVT
ncbi:TPA: hypothetical protein RQN76_001689 [Aeromonas dhakensis]|nr:hypothetical protein [Aeromonas dhakensis]